MDIKEYERIKAKLDTAKDKKTRAQGAKEQIETQLKKDFGAETIKAAEAKAATLSQAIEQDKANRNSVFKELETVTNWEEL